MKFSQRCTILLRHSGRREAAIRNPVTFSRTKTLDPGLRRDDGETSPARRALFAFACPLSAATGGRAVASYATLPFPLPGIRNADFRTLAAGPHRGRATSTGRAGGGRHSRAPAPRYAGRVAGSFRAAGAAPLHQPVA